jgi:hypothetical protein
VHSTPDLPLPPGPPLLCASLSVAIIFISYALHVRYMPFLDPMSSEAVHAPGTRNALVTGATLLYVGDALTMAACLRE